MTDQNDDDRQIVMFLAQSGLPAARIAVATGIDLEDVRHYLAPPRAILKLGHDDGRPRGMVCQYPGCRRISVRPFCTEHRRRESSDDGMTDENSPPDAA